MPQTLVHGDYRLDNLVFPRAEGDGVIAFDWQSVARGPGVLDVAYFISGSLRSEQAPEHELDLLRSWHEAIGAHGVADYPFEQCLADYQRCKLFIAYRTFTGADLIDFSDERGTRLIHGWLKRLAALVPDDFERWLGGGEPAPASPPR